jgi:TRAP-type uncharacterized transport system substrate-binding protein
MSEFGVWKSKRAYFTRPDTTRSRIALEIAAELVAAPNQLYRQAKILLREQGDQAWPLCLFASSTNEGVDAVVKREVALAMINPAAALTLAYRGTGPYSAPQPVRTLAVVPSVDQYLFAVKRDTGIVTFEDIGRMRFPLKVSLRGQPDHCLHMMLDHIVAAAGFTLDDVKSWGGEVVQEGMLPHIGGVKFEKLARGEINAIFDEAVQEWLEDALDADMTILPLAESTVRKLEAMGYRRSVISSKLYPDLPHDILTIDFSGWAIFVHEELSDELVAKMCAALDARKHLIPWERPGPLPLERMCRNSAEAPMDVPLHPAAERFWRERGYLS